MRSTMAADAMALAQQLRNSRTPHRSGRVDPVGQQEHLGPVPGAGQGSPPDLDIRGIFVIESEPDIHLPRSGGNPLHRLVEHIFRYPVRSLARLQFTLRDTYPVEAENDLSHQNAASYPKSLRSFFATR